MTRVQGKANYMLCARDLINIDKWEGSSLGQNGEVVPYSIMMLVSRDEAFTWFYEYPVGIFMFCDVYQ